MTFIGLNLKNNAASKKNYIYTLSKVKIYNNCYFVILL